MPVNVCMYVRDAQEHLWAPKEKNPIVNGEQQHQRDLMRRILEEETKEGARKPGRE